MTPFDEFERLINGLFGVAHESLNEITERARARFEVGVCIRNSVISIVWRSSARSYSFKASNRNGKYLDNT